MDKKISCVIHTYNSAQYLEQCLKSVSWCNEIVIIDMYSSDDTLTIARIYNANIYMHENMGYADPARAFGLSKCKHDWILALDSDEIIMPALAEELKRIMLFDEYDVVKMCRRNFFFGREISGTGWGYEDQLIPRFFKKGYIIYGHEVHNFITISTAARVGKIIHKNKAVIHFNYDSISHFINKLNLYTDFEAQKKYDGNVWIGIIYNFIREVGGRFIIKKGYKDKWLGLYLSLAMAFYRATAIVKRKLPDRADVIRRYYKIADDILASNNK
ncbi:MAG TPA: glycosyltransferase family 2 protein [Clostridia bacterium]